MNHPLLLFLLQIIVISALLWLNYWYLLRNNKFHKYNRLYLLSIIPISILLTMVPNFYALEVPEQSAFSTIIIDYNQLKYQSIIQTNRPKQLSSLLNVSIGIYIAIALLFIIRHCISWWSILRLKQSGKKVVVDNKTIYFGNYEGAPFSFLNTIYWHPGFEIASEEGKLALVHEHTHIQQRHSWDIVFIQIIQAIFWINPFLYFIQKELKNIHEYLADEATITESDKVAFSKMILAHQLAEFRHSSAQSIFYSSIKKRIIMINKTNKTRFAYLRRIAVLPILALLIFIIGTETTVAKNIQEYAEKIILTMPNEQESIQTPLIDTNKSKVEITEQNEKKTYEIIEVDKDSLKNVKITNNDGKVTTFETHKYNDIIISSNEGKLETNSTIDEAKRKIDNGEYIEIQSENPTLKSIKVLQPANITMSKNDKYLYILNGKKMPKDFQLNTIDPQTIKTVTFLTDKSATTLYGDDAQNGVIEITTKE